MSSNQPIGNAKQDVLVVKPQRLLNEFLKLRLFTFSVNFSKVSVGEFVKAKPR